MKLLVHLVRADVRRFRLLLVGWALIEVLNTVFNGVQPVLAGDPRTQTAIGLLGTVLFLSRWFGMFLIVTLVFGALFLSGRVNKGEDIHITE